MIVKVIVFVTTLDDEDEQDVKDMVREAMRRHIVNDTHTVEAVKYEEPES